MTRLFPAQCKQFVASSEEVLRYSAVTVRLLSLQSDTTRQENLSTPNLASSMLPAKFYDPLTFSRTMNIAWKMEVLNFEFALHNQTN
jgi:hypothetical protein